MSARGGAQRRKLLGGGIAGEHPIEELAAILAAPTVPGAANTVRLSIIPVACWRLDDLRFEFDSSFIRPEAHQELIELARLRRDHSDAPLSIFGHADPVGDDVYNKRLSGRRAIAMYALLTRKPEMWEELYKNGEDNWGLKTVQTMLATLDHGPGVANGIPSAQTRTAVEAFQSEQGLSVDGDPGPNTREALFRAYMDVICQDAEANPFSVEPSEFLGRGEDPKGKADYQGCSEFNPLLMFSQSENQELSQLANRERRNQENAPNRRVMVLFFRPGPDTPMDRWPCPRADEGIAGCLQRFWSDAAQRRQFQAQRRVFEDSNDTFACRFYHRLVASSPCERLLRTRLLRVRLFDERRRVIPGAPYRLILDGETREGEANPEGFAVETIKGLPGDAAIEWDRPSGGGEPPATLGFRMDLFLDFEDEENPEEQAKRRLFHLGYPVKTSRPLAEQRSVVERFQFDYEDRFGLTVSGVLDPQTQEALARVHDDCDPTPD